MRPQVDDQTAEAIREIAEAQTEIDVEMLNFDQQIRVVLQNIHDMKFVERRNGERTTTAEGQIVQKL